jgi:AraC-like DNA-binding protein
MSESRTERRAIVPSAAGGITRLAYALAEDKGTDVDILLRKSGLSRNQIEDSNARLDVHGQIKFLEFVAEAIGDDLLGFHLSQTFDLRTVGLLYYVFASSDRLDEALRRGARYSSIVNEGIKLTLHEGGESGLLFEYIGVPRHLDRHQIEFWIATLIRVCRQVTGRHVAADRVSFIHRRSVTPELNAFFGCEVRFDADADEALFSPSSLNVPIVGADPYLNEVLVKYCEEALALRKPVRNALGPRVENAIATLLPHGKAQASEVARRLGMSQRTFARRLASEGLTFATVLRHLRSNLAKRHLADRDLSVSKIAWLLGYRDVSTFTNAFKRWTGKPPWAIRAAHLRHATGM